MACLEKERKHEGEGGARGARADARPLVATAVARLATVATLRVTGLAAVAAAVATLLEAALLAVA